MTNKVIFWDFDGVIADTFEQCYAISRLAYPEMSEREYREMFEGNINFTTSAKKPAQVVDFFAEFEKTILDAPLTQGIAEVIEELSKDYANVIISSTTTPLIDRYLTHHNLRHYFAEILGNDVAPSKVEKFKLGFEKHKTSSSHSVLITDTLGDMVEANEVGVSAIGVLWGFRDREELIEAGAETLVAQPQELLALL